MDRHHAEKVSIVYLVGCVREGERGEGEREKQGCRGRGKEVTVAISSRDGKRELAGWKPWQKWGVEKAYLLQGQDRSLQRVDGSRNRNLNQPLLHRDF